MRFRFQEMDGLERELLQHFAVLNKTHQARALGYLKKLVKLQELLENDEKLASQIALPPIHAATPWALPAQAQAPGGHSLNKKTNYRINLDTQLSQLPEAHCASIQNFGSNLESLSVPPPHPATRAHTLSCVRDLDPSGSIPSQGTVEPGSVFRSHTIQSIQEYQQPSAPRTPPERPPFMSALARMHNGQSPTERAHHEIRRKKWLEDLEEQVRENQVRRRENDARREQEGELFRSRRGRPRRPTLPAPLRHPEQIIDPFTDRYVSGK